MKKGFTLLEVAVAIALLGIMLLSSGLIFKVSIKAFRTACANNEIMQKFRAITDQLNSDFKGLRKDAPMIIMSQKLVKDNVARRYDQIMFFADGEFNSFRLDYGTGNNEILRGNVSRIFYSQARHPVEEDPFFQTQQDKIILARNQHILTPYAGTGLIDWILSNGDFSNFTLLNNRVSEYDLFSLSKWKTVDILAYQNFIMPNYFDDNIAVSNECILVDLNNNNTYHNLMAEGISSFAIEKALWFDTPPAPNDPELQWGWFPEDTGIYKSSPAEYWYCRYFNVSNGINFLSTDGNYTWFYMQDDDWPKALKFTFRIHDSKGVIKGGREFTHIVWIGK